MDDRSGEPAVPEIVTAVPEIVATPPATQAQALATQAHALAVQAQGLAAQAQVLAAQALVAPNNDVGEDEKSVQAYKQIAIVQDINLRYPFHKLALEDWERREEYLRNSVSRREGQSNDLTTQIYTILGIFAVFQGVVLSAVIQLKQTAHPEYRQYGVVPVCGKIWAPIVLSGFATMATFAGIVDKFFSLKSLELTIHKERQAKIEVSKRALRLRSEGPQNFKFHLHTDNSRPATKPKLVKNPIMVIGFLVIFSLICILSYFVILCDALVHRKWDGGFHK